MSTKHPSSDGLRKLADWLDKAHANGVTPMAWGGAPTINFWPYGDEAGIEGCRVLAAELGTFEKVYSDHFFVMRRDFGDVLADFNFSRETVCKRVVTGTKTIPATVIPARPAVPEQVIPEQTVETVEWQCGDSLLAKTFDGLEADPADDERSDGLSARHYDSVETCTQDGEA